LRKAVGIPEPEATPHSISEDEDTSQESQRYFDADGLDSKCSVSEGFGQPNALVLSGGCDKVLKVWDVRTGYCLHTLEGHATTIRCLGVLPHTSLAVTGSRDGVAIVWDIKLGRLIRKLRGHERSVRCISVDWVKAGYGQPGRGMKRAITGSYDSTCRVWDLDTGDCLHVLRGHVADIFCVVFDGARIASAGSDTTVRLWNSNTGECLAILSGHTSPISTLHLSSTSLCSGSLDGRIIMFDLPPLPPLPVDVCDKSSAEEETSSSSDASSQTKRRYRSAHGHRTRLSDPASPQTATPYHLNSSPSQQRAHARSVLDDQFRRSFSGLAHPNFSVTSLQFGGFDSFRFLVTSGNDGLVKVWKIPPREDSEAEEYLSGPGPPSGTSISSPLRQAKEFKDWNKECFIRNLAPNPNDGTVLIIDQAGFERRVNSNLTRDERMDCVYKVVWRRGVCAVMGKVKGKTVVEIWSFR
jgi:WD40 repeat protein